MHNTVLTVAVAKDIRTDMLKIPKVWGFFITLEKS